MKNILGLRTVIYKVSDLEAAKLWYNKVFGTAPYFDEPFYVGYNIGGYELALQPEEVAPAVKTENIETYWGVNNVESEYERFLELGAVMHGAPRDVGGNIVVATVKDPWGNIIGLIYNPHFSLDV